MLDIGCKAPEFRGDGSTVKGIVNGLTYNKIRYIWGNGIGATPLVDFSAAANTESLFIWVYYAKWRIAGFGFRCFGVNFTDNESPELALGKSGDLDLFGKIKVTYPADEKMVVTDIATFSKGDIFANKLSEAATGITLTKGDPDGWILWQQSPIELIFSNTAQLTSGKVYPFILLEIDTEGKW